MPLRTQNNKRPTIQNEKEHAFLLSHPVTCAAIGILHTFLCAGTVFGWASLLPILRSESLLKISNAGYNQIFMAGAVFGNNLSNLPFGYVLDNFGPKICGIVGSVFFASGLILCSVGTSLIGNGWMLGGGYGLLGFAGPGIQIATMHLAKLFHKGEGGSGTYMSAQAAAFDGGTVVFALFSYASQWCGVKASTFFLVYLLVPAFTLCTAIWIWPDTIIPYGDSEEERKGGFARVTVTSSFRCSSSFDDVASLHLAGAAGSHLLTASLRGSIRSCTSIPKSPPLLEPPTASKEDAATAAQPPPHPSHLIDAPLSTVLTHPSFYGLALFVSTLVLKLNFVLGTINDQLLYVFDTPSSDSKTLVTNLINVFGTMLPFGFVLMPLTAYLLDSKPLLAFQLANTIGVLYGAVLTFTPQSTSLLTFVAFPAVACSRQMVYSTCFHEIGALFGFANYGVLFGVVKVIVILVSLLQTPLVDWAEAVGGRNAYFGPNLVLVLCTLPLFGIVWWTKLVPPSSVQEECTFEPDGIDGMERSESGIARSAYGSTNDI